MSTRYPLALLLAVAAGLSLLFTVAAGQPRALAAEVDLENIARDLVRDLADGKYESVVARFSPNMKKELGRDQIAIVTDPLREKRGPAKSVMPRLRHDAADGLVTFTVKCYWLRGKTSDVRVTLKPDGTVVGLHIADEVSPADESARDRYETRAKLRPPFHGTWVAHNAARDGSNPHFAVRGQRFAVDWVIVGDLGRTYRTDGKKNEDYLAWGQSALAPADGTVVIVVDGIPENPMPGERDSYFVPGNHLVMDLGGGEFAMFMHLVPASITVKVGDKVKAGQAVARIGNSGNSTEPHLHFQLCDQPRLTDCTSLPARFSDVNLDGKHVARALPAEGSRLSE